MLARPRAARIQYIPRARAPQRARQRRRPRGAYTSVGCARRGGGKLRTSSLEMSFSLLMMLVGPYASAPSRLRPSRIRHRIRVGLGSACPRRGWRAAGGGCLCALSLTSESASQHGEAAVYERCSLRQHSLTDLHDYTGRVRLLYRGRAVMTGERAYGPWQPDWRLRDRYRVGFCWV